MPLYLIAAPPTIKQSTPHGTPATAPSRTLAMSAIPIHDGADQAAVAAACEAHSITTEEFAALRDKAAAAKATAYCPYSQFRVGAALLAVDEAGEQKWISGANVENVSPPSPSRSRPQVNL